MLCYLLYLVLSIITAAQGQGQGQGPPPCTGRPLACANQINHGNNPPLSSRLADCSSYNGVTITPDPVTVTTTIATETITVTVTDTDTPTTKNKRLARLAARQAGPVPTYLHSPCDQEGVYASACACLGIPVTTTTLPTPTEFVSVTATVTTTVTVQPTSTPFTCPATGGTCPYYTTAPCGLGEFNICACAQDAEGQSFCAVGWTCRPNMDQCTTNFDCAPNQRCHTNNCCGYPGICVFEADEADCDPGVTTLKIRGAGPVGAAGAGEAILFGKRVEWDIIG
ncbi:hypothetical protein BDW74DRAFT_180380 [Aspergillus multicolor]|uniref:uncharacterized protein n=1 Tax=Aspergillus multicolor TaxID=41759 RepID=UPI003CCDFABA